MLTLIRVASYAIIDEVELELDGGFTVVTGETGAGKSILVDALGLALGDRADASAVRRGAKRAEISVVFECPDDHPALQWLQQRGLDDDGGCCLRRQISAEGRSRAFVNNQPVTLQDLRALGALLVDIHGQHAHQSLLGARAQRELLDEAAGAGEQVAEVADAFRQWQSTSRMLRERSEGNVEREARLDMLRFQLDELKELDIEPGEVEELRSERGRLANVDRLLQGLNSALNQIYESDLGSAHSQLAQARRSIESLLEHDASLKEYAGQLGAAEIELREAASGLLRYRDALEADPDRLEWIAGRLDRVRHLARRHRVDDTELHQTAVQLEEEIAQLDTSAESLEALTSQANEAHEQYLKAARKLSEIRRKFAAELGTEVSGQLKELGMPHGEFRVELTSRDEDRGDATGLDDVEFQVQVNPGQGFGPISRVASGGELSRISLALEVVVTTASTIPTFVFDEVDAGIGGRVAEIVGRRLRQIAEHHQVLCVTHLPQVASQGATHFRIVKLTDGESSRTQVRQLAHEERIEELSRMLGGIEITEATRAHAAEMIEQAAAVTR